MGHTRIHAVVLTLLFTAGASVVAVHASPTCERFVRNYVTVPVRNRVSKATDLAWAKWRVDHPNWHQNPKVHRPKYVMTRKESVDKVNFACEVPTVPRTLDAFFTPADLGFPPPPVDVTPMETSQISFPELTPPEVAENPPTLVPPFIPPLFGDTPIPPLGEPNGPPIAVVVPVPPIGPVPEPSSMILTGLGMLSLGWFWARRQASSATL